MIKTCVLITATILLCIGGCNASGAEYQTKTITAYCACEKCCGSNAIGLTANGHKPKQGVTCAASRSIPFGTRIEILGRVYTVQDRLATRYDNRIDLFFTNHADAKAFGKKTVQIKILK
jgi:3D (Asp-Asp-Asp) domain-containing protein